MTSFVRLLVVSDVGGAGTRHLGDEAMLEANLAHFRRLIPDVAFTVVSPDPVWTAAHFGVDAAGIFEFPSDPDAGAARRTMLDRVLADAAKSRPEHPTTAALARADGLIISGGGNLSSTWPDLLYRRVALMQLARIFGKPALVLGQTIGPRLRDDERRLLGEALSSVRLVGVRELQSATLALDMGVAMERLWYQCDDALFPDGAQNPVEPSDPSRTPTIAVTIDSQIRANGERLFGALVRQLRELAEVTGAHLILVPHLYGDELPPGLSDLTEARVLAEQLELRHTVIAAGLEPIHAREVTANASLVISSRYHPIVFALGAGVPSIGIYGDEYCRIKLQGGLAHAGLERWTLTYDDVIQGRLLKSSLELWRARDHIRQRLESCSNAWRAESGERWAAIVRALDPALNVPPADVFKLFGRPVHDVAPALVSALLARQRAWESEQLAFEASLKEAHRRLRVLERKLKPLIAVKRYALALRSKLESIAPRKQRRRAKLLIKP
ncbi:MAG TPA: polysaccharide pyruvyl transferase family protein [Pyrinomonadaceae bacterium]|nr:polysaccharide pyruvyl transferase family protein [Pyrinomonadaceae bacterium]